MAITARDGARQHGPDAAINIANLSLDLDRLTALKGRGRRGDKAVIEGLFQPVFLTITVPARQVGGDVGHIEQLAQINALGLPLLDHGAGVQQLDPANHFIDRADAELGHNGAQFFGDEEEVIDHMLGLASEPGTQDRVLGRHAHRAGIEMAFAHHDTARRNQGRCGKAKLIGTQQGRHRHVAARAKTAIGLNGNTAAQAIEQQGLLGLGQADFPGRAGMGQGGERRGPGAAFKAGNGHMIGA